MNPKVDFFFDTSSKWQEAFKLLRKIALESKLEEELKWGCPCYTLAGANIFLIHGFKEYCAVLFMQGALLQDHNKVLIQQTERVQAARQMRFTKVSAIEGQKTIITDLLLQAIALGKSGVKVKLMDTTAYSVPQEFQLVLNENEDLHKAFQALTPGRQRGYLLYFSAPKQSKTRESRIAKSIEQILAGRGLND